MIGMLKIHELLNTKKNKQVDIFELFSNKKKTSNKIQTGVNKNFRKFSQKIERFYNPIFEYSQKLPGNSWII